MLEKNVFKTALEPSKAARLFPVHADFNLHDSGMIFRVGIPIAEDANQLVPVIDEGNPVPFPGRDISFLEQVFQ